MDYLLQINLEDLLKIYDSAEEISKWIYRYYSDIVNPKIIPEKQVINNLNKIIRLVERLLLFKQIDPKLTSTFIYKKDKNIFEPDEKRKPEETANEEINFYKSETNFFNSDGNTDKLNRQDKYLSNENDNEVGIKDFKDIAKLGGRYDDNKKNNDKISPINQYSDNILDDISVGSLNSLREDSSNREQF